MLINKRTINCNLSIQYTILNFIAFLYGNNALFDKHICFVKLEYVIIVCI